MSLETRSNSALVKRADQLKRWQESETFKEPSEPKAKKCRRIGFSDGCVFLAACAAGDKSEVETLLDRGADIDTANVDGLTALHQACIDDNLEMVEFLVEHNADVNRGDNEGWTPLHATASCGFLSIARYLLEHKANVAAVNNDGELAIDISESDEMEELLQNEISIQKVDCEEARNREEREMLNDARQWLNSGIYGDVPHVKTGATAMHVAAAKGYIKVINILLQAGSQVNVQDHDGWTPLHAASHWAQREACEVLVETGANMEVKNCVGQTPFDVADPDVLRLLEELKKKQATLQKDKPSSDVIKAATQQQQQTPKRRSSITRLSYDDKLQRSKEATVKETIAEEKAPTESRDENKHGESARVRGGDHHPGLLVTDESGKEAVPGFIPPHPDTGGSKEDIAPWRRPGSLRARPSTSISGKLSPSVDDGSVRRAHSFGSDDKRRISEDVISKQSPDFSIRTKNDKNLQTQVRRSFVPPVRDEEHEIQRKAHAKRVRETRRSTQGVTLEDLKSAEQLVKKKQQENAQRTSDLQQLVSNENCPDPPGSTATTTVTTSATLVTADAEKTAERRPSWRLRIDSGEKSRNVPTSSNQVPDKSKSKSQNGDIDYKKLWEESQAENTRLRMEMSSIRQDLDSAKHQLESAIQASTKNAVSDAEKREKKMLEKKLTEMEEELKTLDQLKSDNQRLRDENGALIRVISKLSK